ncbi:hypothetical protein BS47DRAFT_1354565 [Hydnum rufescens UP504]|uniref:Uncharacterized protein n=1 Tax=Hydnum rufescens UP504 TaxID=1448309 RepID=A0A9P6AGJ3_9AGAM|nr:hypothetical protein BS47DRAFT_1354565 [Hydnum rufescens UP504]
MHPLLITRSTRPSSLFVKNNADYRKVPRPHFSKVTKGCLQLLTKAKVGNQAI